MPPTPTDGPAQIDAFEQQREIAGIDQATMPPREAARLDAVAASKDRKAFAARPPRGHDRPRLLLMPVPARHRLPHRDALRHARPSLAPVHRAPEGSLTRSRAGNMGRADAYVEHASGLARHPDTLSTK